MNYSYDENNVFAKILRGELEADVVYQDESVFAFLDIAKKAYVHVLVIPKLKCVDFNHFVDIAGVDYVGRFFSKVSYIASDILSLDGYRLIINTGITAGQEVMHYHCHVLSAS